MTEPAIGIIIQARMGSTRLPGKVLKPIGEKPLLDCIFLRLKALNHTVQIVVATSDQENDDIIQSFCEMRNVEFFRGSEVDVLERYYFCAKQFGFNHIVRMTADNPFTDISELDRLIELHISSGNDYTHSFGQLPLGIGAEIFSFQALETSCQEGKAPNHREHVNEYIQEHPEKFKNGVLEVDAAKQAPEIRLTVDTEDDYEKACKLVQQCGDSLPDTETLIKLCLVSA